MCLKSQYDRRPLKFDHPVPLTISSILSLFFPKLLVPELFAFLTYLKCHDPCLKLILTSDKIKLAIYEVSLYFHLDAQFTQTVFYIEFFCAFSTINYDWPSLLTAFCTAAEYGSSVLLLIQVIELMLWIVPSLLSIRLQGNERYHLGLGPFCCTWGCLGGFIVWLFECSRCKWLRSEWALQMARLAMASLSRAWFIVTVLLSAIHRDLGDKRRAPLTDNLCTLSIFNLDALCSSKNAFSNVGGQRFLLFPFVN